jgi:acyl carrier protein
MLELVEPRVRRVVADHLGVSPEELSPDVSLTDELAVDSLDLIELTLALEAELGITIPESAIDDVRTYGDLVGLARNLAHRRSLDDVRQPALVWARVVSGRSRAGEIQRAGWLTPYTAETITEDALRAGSGARLEVTVQPNVSDATLAQVQDEFGWLGERGVQVTVRRDHPRGAFAHHGPPPIAAA